MNTCLVKPTEIHYKQLYITSNKRDTVLLGYKFELTNTEHTVLLAIAENRNNPISSEQIANRMNIDLSKENLAFHISNINRKAKIITNRVLIKNIAKNGYFLNEEM